MTTNAGYVSDVAYVRHLIDEQAPARMRLAAATGGLVPPPGDDFDYCELGCAHGDTLCALAAAHPKARFLGVDIGADHVASAKRLARDAALENVGFLERDFEALIGEDIGEFDYIAAHGLLSWIAPEKRAAFAAFAGAKLKPGGLLYVSYNTMPGWAAVEPLRQLLLSPLGSAGGERDATTMDRARRGLAFATQMSAAGAEYFARNPAAGDMLATMTRVGLPYVVHEYLHEHWSPMYFARVAWELGAKDLHFAGVIPPHLNFRDTAVPEALEKVFADAADRLTFESLKDFAINEFFRRDVYVKGASARSPGHFDAYLDEVPWGRTRAELPAEMKLPHRVIELDAPVFAPLFAALADGAASLVSLHSTRPELAGWPLPQLRAAMLRLALAELTTPMQTPSRRPAPAPDPEAVFRLPSPYHQMMLRRISSETPLVFASVPAGAGFRSSALEMLAIRVLTEAPGPAREEWVRSFVGKHELRLAIDGRVVADREEQRMHIRAAIDALCKDRLGWLVEHGVMQAAGE